MSKFELYLKVSKLHSNLSQRSGRFLLDCITEVWGFAIWSTVQNFPYFLVSWVGGTRLCVNICPLNNKKCPAVVISLSFLYPHSAFCKLGHRPVSEAIIWGPCVCVTEGGIPYPQTPHPVGGINLKPRTL